MCYLTYKENKRRSVHLASFQTILWETNWPFLKQLNIYTLLLLLAFDISLHMTVFNLKA